MDKRTINLLHWLRFRMLVNAVRHAMSSLLNKLGAMGLTLLILLGLLAFATAVSQAEPMAPLLRSHEPLGLLMFMVIALVAAFIASLNMTLRMQEEDILLVLPAKIRTIIQARLIRTLAVTPLAVLIATLFILGALSLVVRIDILERLPFAYASVLLFVLICLGLLWILSGFSAKHPRNTEYAEIFALVGGIISFLLVIWLLQQDFDFLIGVWEQTYNHPAFRMLMAVPLASVDVFLYGAWNLTTGAELISLLLIAVGIVYVAFRYDYHVFERRVLPYQSTLGRGTERESPPLYEWLDKVRKALHVRLPDAGTGSRAVFALAYSKNFAGLFGAGLMMFWLVSSVFFLLSLAGGSFVAFLFYMLVIVPIGTFFPWVLGISLGPASIARMNLDIVRLVPDEGRKIFRSLLLPEVSLLGGLYLASVVFGAVAWLTPFAPYFLAASLFPALYFLIGYITGVSTAVSVSASRGGSVPEGVPVSLSILPVLPVIIVPAALLSHSIVMMYYLFVIDPVHVVVPLFVITAFGVLSAYLYYLKGCRDLDTLRPRRRNRLRLSLK